MENLESPGILKIIFQAWKVMGFSVWAWKILVLIMEKE